MIRSSVEPQTIASDTAQKANWNRNFASMVAVESPMTGSDSAGLPLSCRKKPLLPSSCDEIPSTSELPNAKAKPTAQ